tara:strand:- start:1464 stop:1700 length:237 start_codon:yes stop_codon:yes gene_type:complete
VGIGVRIAAPQTTVVMTDRITPKRPMLIEFADQIHFDVDFSRSLVHHLADPTTSVPTAAAERIVNPRTEFGMDGIKAL